MAANPVSLLQPNRTLSYPASQLLQGTFVPTILEGKAAGETGQSLPASGQRQLTEDQPVPQPTRSTRTTERAERSDR